jgi:hypothetical protein
MRKSWRDMTVYAPRYFAGHIVIGDSKIEFFNCLMIPRGPTECLLLPGTEESPFYSDFHLYQPIDCEKISEIQYAISVYDRNKDRYMVEKFNHKFKKTPSTFIRVKKTGIHIETVSTPLYKQYNVNQVMDGVTWCNVPILQFVS